MLNWERAGKIAVKMQTLQKLKSDIENFFILIVFIVLICCFYAGHLIETKQIISNWSHDY